MRYRVGRNHKADSLVKSPIKLSKKCNKDYQPHAMKGGLEYEQLEMDKYIEIMHQQG